MLKRENILGLIGAEKYHSCICTTYSFDFLYFEMKVMRALSGAGVQNITVLVDGKYYGTMMEQPTLQEYTINNRYALFPIFSRGIFHPKIMMLFGKKEGLLIIGSGNLTSSGFGGNDEIWGAFHYSPLNSQHAALFKLAWTYLQTFTIKSEGVIQLKTQEWIQRNTPWLNDLPEVKYGDLINYGRGQSLSLLWQQNKLSLYKQLQAKLAGKTVQEISIVSPYYDEDGLILGRYMEDFAPKRIHVVMDETGLIPVDFSPSKNYQFYDWKDVVKTDEDARRLHGKLHHFRCKDGSEYMFFGSANATPEGLGIKGPYHEEAGLLLFSQKGGLLEKAGINLAGVNSYRLSDFEPIPYAPMNSAAALTSFKYKITSAEREEGELSVYLLDECQDNIQLHVFSQAGKIILREKVSKPGKFFQLKIDSELPLHTIQIYTEGGEKPLSPRVVVHDVLQMLKTNPDPKTKNFEIAINEFRNSGDSSVYVELLHYVMDESLETEPIVSRQRVAGYTADTKNNDQKSELKDISTFTVEQQVSHHRALMLSPSLTVADLLKFAFNTKRPKKEQDVREDEQQTDADTAQGDADAHNTVTPPTLAQVRSERQKIIRYFEKLTCYYYDRCHDSERFKDYKATLSDMARFVIAVNLISEYTGKFVPGVLDGDRNFCYIKDDNEADLCDNLKSLMLCLTGWFLQMCTKGTEVYEYDYTKRKWEELKQEALVKTVVLLCRASWNKHDEQSFFSLMVNTLVYLGSKTDNKTVIQEVLKHLNGLKSNPITHSYRFQENYSVLRHKVFPAYERLTNNLAQPIDKRAFVTALKTGDVIYSSKFGVGHVTTVQLSGASPSVGFFRPGLEWNDDLGWFKNIQIKGQSKFIPVLIS